MRKLFLLLPVLVGVLALAAAAGATPPTTETFHEESSFDIDCGSFVLHEEFVADVRETTFYNAEGSPQRLQAHITFLGTITAPDGQVIRDPGFFTVRIDLTDGTETHIGLEFNIVIPGQGSVVQDTGVAIFEPDGDVVLKGPHDVNPEQPIEPLLCPLFE
jgi:hypothetical protein